MSRARAQIAGLAALACIASLACLVTACGDDPRIGTDESRTGTDDPLAWGQRYLADAQVGREALEGSLVETGNGYAQLRLNSYGPGREWSRLPVVDAPVRPVGPADIGTIEGPWATTEGEFRSLGRLEAESHEAVMAYGRRAFMNYPLGVDGSFQHGLDSDDDVDRFGLWRAEERVGGVVRVRLDHDSEAYAPTCSTCHASVDDAGAFAPGRPNAEFDYDAMALHGASGPGTYPESRWGAGAVDVTSDQMVNPAAMADLRAVRYQRNLHWAATLRNSFPALVVRIETLIITSLDGARPPRDVPFAIAYYLWNLGESGEIPVGGTGAELFRDNCSSCHGNDGSAGPPVPVGQVGTDAKVARSTSRGLTPAVYRVPSLWKVGTRGQFLHDGRVGSIDALLDPARLEHVPGHPFGTHLSESDREALAEFVRRIGAQTR